MKTIILLLIQILLFINIMKGIDTYTWDGSWSPSTPAGHLDDDNKGDIVSFSSDYSTPALVLSGTNSNEDITINVSASQTVTISSLTYGRNVTINLLAGATLTIGDIDCDVLVINQTDGSSLTTGNLNVTDLTVNTGDDDGDTNKATTTINGTLTNSGDFTVSVEQGCEFYLDAGSNNITVSDIVFNVKSGASMEITVGILKSTGNNGATINVEDTGELIIHGDLVVGSQFDFTIANGGSLVVDNFTLGNSVDGDVDGTLTINENLTLAQNGNIDSPGGTGEIIVGGVIDDPNGVIDSAIIDNGTFYIWNGSQGSDYQDQNNWTPARSTPGIDDVLQFVDETVEVTNVPTQTIKKLTLSNSNITLTPTTTSTLNTGGLNDGSVSILTGASLTISAGLTISAVNVTIETGGELIITDNDQNNSGQLYATGTIDATNATCIFERWLRGKQYHSISSPVINASKDLVSGVTPKFNFAWDETNSTWTSPDDALLNGKAYDYYFPNNQTAIFSGSNFFNQSTFDFSVSRSGPNADYIGLNFVGNPYPFAIDADLFLQNAQNTGVIEGNIWIWDEPDNTIGAYNDDNYIVYNTYLGTTASSAVSSREFDGNIAPAQGFFVKKFDGGGPDIRFTKSMNSSNNATFFKSAKKEPADIQKIKLAISGNDLYNEIIIGLVDDATEGFDPKYDAVKNVTNSIALYSFIENKKYTIQAQKKLENNENRIVEIGTKISVEGNYKFNLQDIVQFEGVSIYLEDLILDTTILLSENSYIVHLNKGSFDKRFRLIFQNSIINTEYKSLNLVENNDKIDDDQNISQSITDIETLETTTAIESKAVNLFDLYSYKDRVYVNKRVADNALLEVYNISGRKISTHVIYNIFTSLEVPFASGLYIVRINIDNNTTSLQKKIFIE